MKKPLHSTATLLFTLFCQLSTSASAVGDDIAIKPCGLRIVAMPRGGESQMRAFNWSAGTTMAVLIESQDRFFVDYDRSASEILAYVDDVGSDLKGEYREGKLHGSEISKVEYSTDRRAALLHFFGSGEPAANASSVRVTGKLKLWHAASKKTYRQQEVRLATGENLHIGSLMMTLGEVRQPAGGRSALSVELESDHWLSPIANLRFLDEDGTEIEARRTGYSHGRAGPTGNASWTYHLKRKATLVTIEIEEWQNTHSGSAVCSAGHLCDGRDLHSQSAVPGNGFNARDRKENRKSVSSGTADHRCCDLLRCHGAQNIFAWQGNRGTHPDHVLFHHLVPGFESHGVRKSL